MKKKWKYVLFLILVNLVVSISAQVAINEDGSQPDQSAMLHIKSYSKGLLIPRMSAAQRKTISLPALGLLVYQTDFQNGFYFYDGNSWVCLESEKSAVKKINDLTDAKTTNWASVFIGSNSGINANNWGSGNVGLGNNSLSNNTSGSSNIGIGYKSLFGNTSGNWNTAMGTYSLQNNTIGKENTAVGYDALDNNVAGNKVTAIGYGAMQYASDTSAAYDNESVAVGYEALRGSYTLTHNTGAKNTAVGFKTLNNNEGGALNSVLGHSAMINNKSGWYNASLGASSMFNNISGSNNSILGDLALFSNTTGDNNVAIGYRAGYLSTGNSNIYIGNKAGFYETGSNKLYIENSDVSNPLIYGDFDANELKINGELQVTQRMGIGTSNPDTKLHVFYSGTAEPLAKFEATDDASLLINGQGGESYLEIQNDDTSIANSWKIGTNDANRLDIQYGAANTMNNNTLGISVLPNGKVGINKINPEASLEVNGQIKIGSGSESPKAGMMRWNSTANDFEGYNGIEWVSLTKGKAGAWGSTNVYENQALGASDGAFADFFGYAVHTSGNYLIASNERDEVYIFYKNGSIWEEQAILTASDGGSNFGYSLTINGEYAVIGDNGSEGAIYIFKRNGTNWTEQIKITASDGFSGNHFGESVSMSGEYIVVGASEDKIGNNSEQGSVYVFERSGTTWNQIAKIYDNTNGASGDNFGTSVYMNGEYLVVGAPNDDNGSVADQGSIHIYKRNGYAWTQEAYIFAPNGAQSDNFGISVCIDGDFVIAGAYKAYNYNGVAYIYKRNGASWYQHTKLIEINSGSSGLYGNSVAIKGDYAVVGASEFDINNSFPGAAFLYRISNDIWIKQTRFQASDGGQADRFGRVISLSNNTVAVGAVQSNYYGNDHGTVYVFNKQ